MEQRMGVAKAKKKSLKARLVFRVSFKCPDGGCQTLQIASHPILCSEYCHNCMALNRHQ